MIAFSVTLGGHPHVLFSFGLCPDIIVESHSALSKKRLHALHLPLCTIPAISKNAVKSILGLGPTICFFFWTGPKNPKQLLVSLQIQGRD